MPHVLFHSIGFWDNGEISQDIAVTSHSSKLCFVVNSQLTQAVTPCLQALWKKEEEEKEEQILLSQIKLHNYYYSNHNI